MPIARCDLSLTLTLDVWHAALMFQFLTRQLKTACGHLMPLQHHLYNGTCPPRGLFHFCTGMDLPVCGRVHVGTGMDWPARTAGYGNFSQLRAGVGTGQTTGQWDNET